MVTVGMYYDVLPGRGPDFEGKFTAVVVALRAADGHKSSFLYRRVDDPDSYAILSEWDDPAAFHAFLRSEAFRVVTAWGRAEVLRAAPRHKIYPRSEDIGRPGPGPAVATAPVEGPGRSTRREPSKLLGLMAFVGAVAVALAAWRSGSLPLLKLLYGTTVLVLTLAIVAARYRPDEKGAFWLGFAVFGWGYFLIGYGPWSDWQTHPYQRGALPIANRLMPTEDLLRSLAKRFLEPLDPSRQPGAPGSTTGPDGEAKVVPTTKQFINDFETYRYRAAVAAGTGHLVLAWLSGYVGGVLTRRLRRLSRP